jgi:putative glutamine amidotransferase
MNDHRAPLIGLSPRLMRNLPPPFGLQGKTLQYLEQSVAHWVMAAGAIAVMIPTVDRHGAVDEADIALTDYVNALDGLILQGGADIDPIAYGEPPHALLQATDPVRDRFELALLRAFAQAGKPVFGICRGMQLINVAFGGSLHQDLVAGGATSAAHVSGHYDEHSHALTMTPGGWLAGLYPGPGPHQVNSIHHQGVNRLGDGLCVEAWSDDGVPECLRHTGPGFVLGVQWHPEFHDHRFPQLMPGAPLLAAFLDAARRRRQASSRDA